MYSKYLYLQNVQLSKLAHTPHTLTGNRTLAAKMHMAKAAQVGQTVLSDDAVTLTSIGVKV